MCDHIKTKIENLKILGQPNTYLFITLSKDIEEFCIELYSENSKIIVNSTIDDNSLSSDYISTLEINPIKKYFLKVDYRLKGEIEVNNHHEFIIINEIEKNIEMIIHKKKDNVAGNEYNFDNITCNNFFMDNRDDESYGIDPEEYDSSDNDEQEEVNNYNINASEEL